VTTAPNAEGAPGAPLGLGAKSPLGGIEALGWVGNVGVG
jgi:hypothetical protein